MIRRFILALFVSTVLSGAANYQCTIEQSTLPGTPIPLTTIYVTGPTDGPAELSVVLEYRGRSRRVGRLSSTAFSIGAGQWETFIEGIRDPIAAYVQ